MRAVNISADELVSRLLSLAESETVCILDSCGVGYLGSHLLVAGISPSSVIEIREVSGEAGLRRFEEEFGGPEAAVFTLSYDLGSKLLGIRSRFNTEAEPDVFLARFPVLIVHDYAAGATHLVGDEDLFDAVQAKLFSCALLRDIASPKITRFSSNFSRREYIAAIEEIKERIRAGDTYQTNLTHQLSAELSTDVLPAGIFASLRSSHPAPFSAYLRRNDSTVISASPERFFRMTEVEDTRVMEDVSPSRVITTSPIKGTRPRGITIDEDAELKNELLNSAKDRAENTMIVDLLRNDLGRVCKFGSVTVEKLCELEEHPSYFHLVSTITGELRADAGLADILRALFPCGSITGAPKISTMRIIDEIETAPRGLSMGAIGYHIPGAGFGMADTLDLSVAIRTMVIRDQAAIFNVGGGITIDSDPDKEWDETLTKAEAMLSAINGHFDQREQIDSDGV